MKMVCILIKSGWLDEECHNEPGVLLTSRHGNLYILTDNNGWPHLGQNDIPNNIELPSCAWSVSDRMLSDMGIEYFYNLPIKLWRKGGNDATI